MLSIHTHQPTRRWHGALARAAGDLIQKGETGTDLRIPITMALIQQLGSEIDSEQLAKMVELMLHFTESTPDTH